MAGSGDCYVANGRFAMEHMDDKDYKLCHGVGILQTDGKPFGHCWVEYKNAVCFDYSNGNNIEFPKSLYLGLLKAPVKGTKIYRYTGEQVAIKSVKYGHWGPWDYDPPR
jgi:hypothetical protein